MNKHGAINNDTPAESGRFGRRGWTIAAILAVALALWLPRLSGPIDLRYDAGVYYALGTSLAEGSGYRIVSEPGAPEGVQYPPLLPAAVATYQWILGTSDPAVVAPWLRRMYCALYLGYGLAALTLATRWLRPAPAFFAAVLALLELQTVFLSDLLFTELPFALLMLGLFLVLRPTRANAGGFWRETAAFLLAGAGFLLRSAGIALLTGWVAEALLRKKWRLAVVRGGLALVPFALWQAHVMRVQSSDDYLHPAYEYQRAAYQYYNVSYARNIALLDPFQPELGPVTASALARRLVVNAALMPPKLGDVVSTAPVYWLRAVRRVELTTTGRAWLPEAMGNVPGFFLGAGVLAGLWFLFRRREWLVVTTALASIALVCTTPWPGQFARYLSPLAAVFSTALVLAGVALDRAIRQRGRRKLILATRVVLFGGLALTIAVQALAAKHYFGQRASDGGMYEAATPPRFFFYDDPWRNWQEAVRWVQNHAQPDAIVATTSPHWCHLLTGLKAVLPPMEANVDEAQRLLAEVPVEFVIVDELHFLDISRRYALPAMLHAPQNWQLAFTVSGTQVYARRHDPR